MTKTLNSALCLRCCPLWGVSIFKVSMYLPKALAEPAGTFLPPLACAGRLDEDQHKILRGRAALPLQH
jgi:hypothetical protein